jgi:hypothetical protein
MQYVICFIISILLNVLSDNIILSHLNNSYSSLFISFFLYFSSFLTIFLFKRRIILRRTNLFRAFLCSMATYFTLKAYHAPEADIVVIASMYYVIPVFESIIYMIFNRRYNSHSLFSIICNIICFILFSKRNIPICGIMGCFFFSLSDILIGKSNSKDLWIDISSVSLLASMMLFVVGFSIEGKSFIQYSFNNVFLWFTGVLWAFSEILVSYAYKYSNPIKLSPFRYIDLIFLNSCEGLSVRKISMTKALVPTFFMISMLFI